MIFVDDHRFEIQANAIFFPNDRDAVGAIAGLKNGYRKLTTGEEARLLIVHRDQVWFGQLAEGALSAQQLEHCRSVD